MDRRKLTRLLAALAAAALVLLGGIELYRRQGTPVPVLMYHHFMDVDSSDVDTIVTVKRFREQLLALKAAGYTPVDPFEIADFV